jgi:beta-carotene hydroxylase
MTESSCLPEMRLEKTGQRQKNTAASPAVALLREGASSFKRQKPKLPPRMIASSYVLGIAVVIYALAWVIVTGLGSYYALTSLPIYVALLPVLVLSILGGYGVSMLAQLGHEGMHGFLVPNKTISALLGIAVSSCVMTYFEMGFAMRHWQHHRFANQTGDPDLEPTAHLTRVWQRLLFTRWIFNVMYFKNTWRMASGKPFNALYPLAYPLPFQILLARLNLVLSGAMLSLYAVVAWRQPLIALCVIGLPHLAAIVITACQSYLDHAGLPADDLNNAYSRTHWGMTVLNVGTNYHLEHHAYPHVPCYRLPRVHRYLKAQGFIQESSPALVPGFFAAYRNIAKPYRAHLPKNDVNPFVSE